MVHFGYNDCMTTKIKHDAAPIREYYATLQTYADHDAVHEGATETAFSQLLAKTGRARLWTLIPKKKKTVGKKQHIYPDGTLLDVFKLARGYWEAKDTDDDLDAEIQKKIEKKYPLTNTIFEDTTRAVLFQNGKESHRYDLAKTKDAMDSFSGNESSELVMTYLGLERKIRLNKGFEDAVPPPESVGRIPTTGETARWQDRIDEVGIPAQGRLAE